MDDTRSSGHSSALDDQSDRGAHGRVDPLRNGHVAWTEDLLGNPFRLWSRGWSDGSSRSDASTSRETRTRSTCPGWKIPGRRSVVESAQVQGADGNGKSD